MNHPGHPTSGNHRRNGLMFALLAVLLAVLAAANMVTGDSGMSLTQLLAALRGEGDAHGMASTVMSIRATRAAVAVITGAALSASGLQMQTVFRNPLADPYLLGISSGASLGAALLMLGVPMLHHGAATALQSLGVAGAAWVGAALVLVAVGVVSRWVKNILGILIIGVMFGYVASALIQILQYMSSAENLKTFSLWSMGSIGNVTTTRMFIMAAIVTAGLALSVICIKPLNLLLLGEDYARTMGLDVRKSRIMVFTSVTLLAGTTTAFCGPVGFIGLAVPHIARMLFANADHRILLPATVLVGMDTMLVCDLVAKNLVLPVNSITALMGIPVIVWVVFRNLRLVRP